MNILNEKEKSIIKTVLVLLGILALISLILYILWQAKELFISIILSMFFAFLFYPIASFIRKKLKITFLLSNIIFFVLIAGICISLFFSIIPLLLSETKQFMANLPQTINSASAKLAKLREFLSIFIGTERMAETSKTISDFIQNLIVNGLENVLKTYPQKLVNLINLFPFFIFMFYFMNSGKIIIEKIKKFKIFSEGKDKLDTTIMDITGKFRGYIAALALTALINSTAALTIGMLLKIPYTPVLALIVLIGEFIPYVGSIFAFTMGALLAISQGFGTFMLFAVLYGTIEIISSQIIEPKIISQKINLSFPMVVLLLFLGGKLFGIFGMIFIVPIFVLLKAIYDSDLYGLKTKLQKIF